jgi:hypothetical protein
MVAVQAQAGHRSIESTRIYLHLANDRLAGGRSVGAAAPCASSAGEQEGLDMVCSAQANQG